MKIMPHSPLAAGTANPAPQTRRPRPGPYNAMAVASAAQCTPITARDWTTIWRWSRGLRALALRTKAVMSPRCHQADTKKYVEAMAQVFRVE